MAAPDAPWYRHPWPWLLMLPPASTVVFWAVILITTSEPPALVVDDYARIGLTYAENRERDATARRLGVQARLELDRRGSRALLVLEAPGTPPEQLRLDLIHPTRASRDLRVSLIHQGGGRYAAPLEARADSRWRVQLEPPGSVWRLAGQLPAGVDRLELTPPGSG